MAIFQEIENERAHQIRLGLDESNDRKNNQNDWVAHISIYNGRAADKVGDFRGNMIKIATLAVAAIEAYDKGYC